ncbi:MAG: DUF922 domain-containing Zn-dependent protease [Rhizobiaceae bacterium]
MIRFILTMALVSGLPAVAAAASLSKTYSYFSIGGYTLEEIEEELNTRGPQVNSTGRRHPGATQMEFTTRLGYSDDGGNGCTVTKAQVTVSAKVILPRWRHRSRADGDTRMVWDTLSSDIKRHEESHVVIARNHARELEDSLKKIGRQKDCSTAADRAKSITADVLARHDAAQDKFDRIEGINFESRLLRLLQYRMEQAQDREKRG